MDPLSRDKRRLYTHFWSDILVFVTIRFLTDLNFRTEYGWSSDQCGCKIMMRAYGFGPDFQIQCISMENRKILTACAVRIAVNRPLYLKQSSNR